MTDEPRLWEQARAGDGEAFATLYDRHRDRVFRQALRTIASPHDAEDITALVFLEAWRLRERVRLVDGSIVAWLLVTANYVALNTARSARRHRIAMSKIAPAPDTRDHSDDVLDSIDAESRDGRMRQAFSRLRPGDRDVLTLCVLHEYPLAQVAQTLDVPLGTVKSRLSRAKRRLAALLGEPALADSPASASAPFEGDRS